MPNGSDWDDGGLPDLGRLMGEAGGRHDLDQSTQARIVAGGRRLRRRQRVVQSGAALGIALAVVVGTAVLAVGRDEDSKDVAVASPSADPTPGRCKQSVAPGTPPSSPLKYEAVGHPGNEWTVPFEGGQGTVRFVIEQLPETEVTRLTFRLSPHDKPTDDNIARSIEGGLALQPGTHEFTLTWDGADETGRFLGRGRYRITANALVLRKEKIRCTNGRVIDGKPSQSSYTSSLGSFRVTATDPARGNPDRTR